MTCRNPGGQLPRGHDVDRGLVLVGLHPRLHHAGAVRSVAQDRGRHHAPAQRLGDGVRRHLAAGQGALGEVPQRTLPRDRLVDDLALADGADEGGVGRRHHAADQRDLAVEEVAAPLVGQAHGSRRRKPLARTHRWPSGSIGLPQNGQVGATGADHLAGALDERPGAAGRDPDHEHLLGLRLGEVLLHLVRGDHGGLVEREDLDHDAFVGGVPGQRHGAGPELLVDRLVERVGVVEVERGDGRDQALAWPRCPSARRAGRRCARRAPAPAASPARCSRPARPRAPGGRTCAAREGRRCRPRSARAGRSRGREEPCQPPYSGPEPPPTAASVVRRRRDFALGGVSQPRSPSWVLVASTNGRSGV